ncbi:MAG: ribbon-helix-helix domain-containing protein [Alphaproteobacteria bacterium]|nr:ribbon-helix-helix domain-containing protein [Alphaproteobacteria bacterium]
MKKISVIIAGRHYTSITLEEEFYEILLNVAQEKKLSINALVTEIDIMRNEKNNLSSAIRIYILEYLKQKILRLSQ